MKHSEVLNRYVNTGSRIPEEQYDQLSPSLKKSYKRIREIAAEYDNWELKMLTDDEKIKHIEKKSKELNYYDIEYLLYYSENKDLIAIKIIESKGKELDGADILYLLEYSKDKELIKKTLLQNGVDYKLINDVIIHNVDENISLIPDNYQETLNEIRRIKEIMK